MSSHGIDGNFDESDHYKIAVSQTYFAFTTLSTVGFGDFHPRSDYERIFASFILLSGVSMFSYIIGCFTEMMSSIKESGENIDEKCDLTLFFNSLKYFNQKKEINLEFK